jgi:hypothetical protein
MDDLQGQTASAKKEKDTGNKSTEKRDSEG